MKDREKDRANTKLHLVKDPNPDEKFGSKQDAPEEKKSGRLRLREMMELEEEDDIWEDDEDEEKERPWMIVLTFLGLAVLAAIICAVLWYFTHPGKTEEGGQNGNSNVSGALDPGEGFAGGQPGDEGNPASGQTQGNGEDAASGQTGGGAGNDASRQPDAGDEGNDSSRQPDAGGEGNDSSRQPGAGGEGNDSSQQTGTGEAGYDAEEPQGNREESPNQGTEMSEPAEIPGGQEQEPISGTAGMKFAERQESVTPKDVVNLRSAPTTADEENIVVQCRNGEILTRTGMNDDTGWSRIDYDSQTLYAVTQYLTTDLDYKPPVQASNPNRVSTASGRVVVFTDCDDWISPKEYVNLRTEPSTDEGNDTVSCRLEYGQKAHRTGYSTDSGWSRVEYDGKVLYVVTSLVYVVEPD
ncbi:MAG TPA: hypothetical protein DCZ91_03195 [Lachnospiraceae bacterium]|nr:hypothetical protein [Lachnospiraceae bacterium]